MIPLLTSDIHCQSRKMNHALMKWNYERQQKQCSNDKNQCSNDKNPLLILLSLITSERSHIPTCMLKMLSLVSGIIVHLLWSSPLASIFCRFHLHGLLQVPVLWLMSAFVSMGVLLGLRHLIIILIYHKKQLSLEKDTYPMIGTNLCPIFQFMHHW